jgi:hypothetical protein
VDDHGGAVAEAQLEQLVVADRVHPAGAQFARSRDPAGAAGLLRDLAGPTAAPRRPRAAASRARSPAAGPAR